MAEALMEDAPSMAADTSNLLKGPASKGVDILTGVLAAVVAFRPFA